MNLMTSQGITGPFPVPTEPETPWTPSPPREDYSWMSRVEWWERFQTLRQHPDRQDAKLVFMGDSITEGWPNLAPEIWAKTFGPLSPLCLGIGGDRTQHLLWRMDHGELSGLNPRVLVLLIGINNLNGGDAPDACIRGVDAVLSRIHKNLPDTSILLLGLLPSGEHADDPLRARIHKVNQGLASLRRPLVFYADPGSNFLRRDGSIDAELMPDFLHPAPRGYEVLARALLPHLANLFGADVIDVRTIE